MCNKIARQIQLCDWLHLLFVTRDIFLTIMPKMDVGSMKSLCVLGRQVVALLVAENTLMDANSNFFNTGNYLSFSLRQRHS